MESTRQLARTSVSSPALCATSHGQGGAGRKSDARPDMYKYQAPRDSREDPWTSADPWGGKSGSPSGRKQHAHARARAKRHSSEAKRNAVLTTCQSLRGKRINASGHSQGQPESDPLAVHDPWSAGKVSDPLAVHDPWSAGKVSDPLAVHDPWAKVRMGHDGAPLVVKQNYMAMGHNLWLYFGVDKHPFVTYFDVHQGQGFDPQPHLSSLSVFNQGCAWPHGAARRFSLGMKPSPGRELEGDAATPAAPGGKRGAPLTVFLSHGKSLLCRCRGCGPFLL